jgi:hypothetical protein
VEPAFQIVVPAQRAPPLLWMGEHPAGLLRKGSNRGPWRDRPAMGCLLGDAADRAPRNGWNCPEQMPGLGIAMKRFRHIADTPGEVRRRPSHRARDLRQRLLRHGCDRFRYNRQEFAGRHSDERKEVVGSLLLRFRIGGQLSKVLHHRVRINFANGIELAFLRFQGAFERAFVGAFVFTLAFAEKTADYVADGSEPTLSFEARLPCEFLFALTRKFIFEFVLDHFTLELISHDDSSCKSGRRCPSVVLTGWSADGTAAPALEACSHCPARPLVGAADFHIPRHCGGACFRAAQHATHLLCGSLSNPFSGNGNSIGCLTLQVLHSAAHDRGDSAHQRTCDSAAAQNASENG